MRGELVLPLAAAELHSSDAIPWNEVPHRAAGCQDFAYRLNARVEGWYDVDIACRVAAERLVDNSVDACIVSADQYLVVRRLDEGLLDDRRRCAEVAGETLADDPAIVSHAVPGSRRRALNQSQPIALRSSVQ